ncbi:MAG TPA: hypothetical protein PLG94_11870, partial [Smithellaceae bacterium]|nr:hypothetical protein [Smithellaceae bacterium]
HKSAFLILPSTKSKFLSINQFRFRYHLQLTHAPLKSAGFNVSASSETIEKCLFYVIPAQAGI